MKVFYFMTAELQQLVLEWMHFSQEDFNVAKHLFETMYPKPLELICFHCQQASEKAVKALLIANNIEVIKIHDLFILLKRLEKILCVPENIKTMAERLSPYATSFRYPQELPIDEALTKKALNDMEAVVTWAKETLEEIE